MIRKGAGEAEENDKIDDENTRRLNASVLSKAIMIATISLMD